MADINLKTETPDTSLPTTGFLFGADSQAASSPSVYTTQAVATTLLGSTTLSGTTITANAPVLNLSQTWNNAAVTFTGLQFNAAGSSDANSAAASLLLDLQVGGASRARFAKSGSLIFTVASKESVIIPGDRNFSFSFDGLPVFGGGLSYFGLTSSASLRWTSSTTDPTATADLFLTRKDTRNLRLGAADAATALAQTFSVQSVVAGTTDGAGANFTITGSQGTGQGVGGSIIFQVAPASVTSGTVQNTLSTALTIASDKSANFDGWIYLKDNRFFSGSTAGSVGVAIFNQQLNTSTAIRFASGSTYGSTITELVGESTDTLALRNATAAQVFRVYNTWSSGGTNFERLNIGYSSGVAYVETTGSGTGTQRNLTVGGAIIDFRTGTTSRWNINGSGHFVAEVDNTYDIGAAAGSRPRYLYLAGGSLTGSAANSSLEISPTWNTSGTPTAIKLNVTDTASNAASLLMDLGTGGGSFVSRFNVNKAGKTFAAGGLNVGNAADDATLSNGNGWASLKNLNGGSGISFAPYGGNQTTAYLNLTGTSINVPSGAVLGWSSTSDPTATRDLFLGRRDVRNLRLGAADAATALAQTFSVQSVVAGTTDGAGANFTITGSQGTGSGAGGSIIFQVAPASVTSGTVQNTPSTALTIASNRDVTFEKNIIGRSYVEAGSAFGFFMTSRSGIVAPSDGVLKFSNNAENDFNRIQLGGTTSSFPALKRNSTALETKLADDSAYAPHAMQYLDVTDGITAPSSATGRARIYVDTADGDLKVIFADGTVKTIVTDT